MTIAEFLMARIAEDERQWANPAFVRLAGPWLSDFITKMRAECEAKRQIVALHSLESEACGGFREDITHGDLMSSGWVCPNLAALAAIYADHPDFREEWRV